MGLFKKKKQYSFDVVGLPYYRENQAKISFKNAVIAKAIPEPDNEHDKNAIMVTVNDTKIGHAPARQCKLIKGILNKNPYDTKIVIRGTLEEWESARVTLFYKE